MPCRTPLHCAASCNNVQVCKFLVESGAAVFAMTYSDMQTAADKCEEMEEGYTQCSQFLYGECHPWATPCHLSAHLGMRTGGNLHTQVRCLCHRFLLERERFWLAFCHRMSSIEINFVIVTLWRRSELQKVFLHQKL